MIEVLPITEVASRPGAFLGREVAVDGTLLVGADSRLVAEVNRPEEHVILLPHPDTERRLLSAVPAWGGGSYIYVEKATVVGTLAHAPLRFEFVASITVSREQKYEV